MTKVSLANRLGGASKRRSIIFIRHGQTALNHGGRIDGRSPQPLNALGRRQAEAAGLYAAARDLAGDRPWHLLSSPLERALETARLAFPQATPIVEHGFAEVDVGALQGLGWTEAMAKGLIAADHDFASPFPGGESYALAQRRGAQALTRHLGALDGDLVITAHGGIIVLMITALLEIPGHVFPFTEIDNGSISVVHLHEFDGHSAAKLKLLNYVPA